MPSLELGGLRAKRGRKTHDDGVRIRYCVLCGDKLSNFAVIRQNILCRSCTDILRERFEYHLPANRPVFPTLEQAYAHLFVAIREQAREDHKLYDWRSYWLGESGLAEQMKEILSKMRTDHTVHLSDYTAEQGKRSLA